MKLRGYPEMNEPIYTGKDFMSTQTKVEHTPGTWKTGAWTSSGIMIRGPKNEYIGFAQGYPDPDVKCGEVSQPEAEANAKLFAAGPDMLAALKLVYTLLGSYAEDDDGSEVTVAMLKVKSAIALGAGLDDSSGKEDSR